MQTWTISEHDILKPVPRRLKMESENKLGFSWGNDLDCFHLIFFL